MDQQDILCNSVCLTGLLFPACSLCGLLSCSHILLLCLLVNLCPSVAVWISDSHRLPSLAVHMSPCLSHLSGLFPPSSPRISRALWLLAALSLSSSFSHTPIVHLTSSLRCLCECQAGRPWSDLAGNELLITSREKPSIQHPPRHPPPHPMQHTQKKERGKKKTTQLSHAQPTKRNSIGEAGQRGRGADEKSLEKLLQALIYNYQTSKTK